MCWNIGCIRFVRTGDPPVPVLLEVHLRRFDNPLQYWPYLIGVHQDPRCMDKRRRVSGLFRQCRRIDTARYDQAIQRVASRGRVDTA